MDKRCSQPKLQGGSKIMVHTDWVMDSKVSFQRNGNCHENGSAHCYWLYRIQKVWKKQGMQRCSQAEISPEILQNAAKEEPTIETQEGDQQKIECISHLIPEKKQYKLWENIPPAPVRHLKISTLIRWKLISNCQSGHKWPRSTVKRPQAKRTTLQFASHRHRRKQGSPRALFDCHWSSFHCHKSSCCSFCPVENWRKVENQSFFFQQKNCSYCVTNSIQTSEASD